MKRFIVLVLLFCFIVIPLAVFAEPPKVVLSVDKTEGVAPFTIKVSEISEDKEIVAWEWDFGDGTHRVPEKDASHTYDRAGAYLLTVTVFNEKGEKASQSVTIVVKEEVKVPSEATKFVTVWSGATPIKDSLTLTSAAQKPVILKTATSVEMAKIAYPYDVAAKAESPTTFKIIKFRCDEKMQICGYWVQAWRSGQEVATNSPIWISPPPITALISETYDAKSDTLTTTLKEDPRAAVEQILQQYVDNQPLGKPIIGTKE
jgi:PKD repeat protein